jgi:hypothetical protein
MYKIICTGNPNHIGIAKEIKRRFPDAMCVSRSSGFDLSTQQGLDKFKIIINDYNVLVNSSHVIPGTQEALLEIAHKHWHTGHVFNIGSIDEYDRYANVNNRSHIEKNQLKNLAIAYNSDNFKVTHITVGPFESTAKPLTEPLDRLDPKHIAETIKWILECNFDVPVIGVQRLSDKVAKIYQESQFT